MIISHTTSHTLDLFQRLTFIGHVSHFLSSHINRSIFPSKSDWRRDFHETEEVEAFWIRWGWLQADSYVSGQRSQPHRKYKMCRNARYCFLSPRLFFVYALILSLSSSSYDASRRYVLSIATKLEYNVMQRKGFRCKPSANVPSFYWNVH